MVEPLQNLSLADTQPLPDITVPFKPWKNGGLINRHRLFKTLATCATHQGVQPDVSYGVNAFLHKRFLHPDFNLAQVVTFMVALSQLTEGVNYYKSRSLNYLSEGSDVDAVLHQTLENARFMIGFFGLDFFSRSHRFPERRKIFFKALIPDSNFYLTAKAGSGAGTFSVDFALGIEKGQGFASNRGEIWRTGFDTEVLPDEKLGVRIIRTGNGVRHDPSKTAQFEVFKDSFKTSPARALTPLVICYAQRVRPDRITALSTHGAKILSSLPKDPHAYSYTRLFREIGFVGREDGYWLELAALPNPRKRERAGFERLTETFRNLRDADGKSLPLLES